MNRGINLDGLDTNINPGEDFYMFVNGGWMQSTSIPSDRSSWGSFHELSKATDAKVLGLLLEELKEKGPSPNKAGRLFESGMDTGQIERVKLETLDNVFTAINSLADYAHLPSLLSFLATKGLSGFLQTSVHPDMAESHQYAAYLESGNLGLPERDFYLDEDEKAIRIRDEYLH